MQRERLDPLRRLAGRIPGLATAARWLRRLADPELRQIERLRSNRAGELFQPFPTTSEDRYPELFDELARRLSTIERPRILSFGCADGSEVRSLRRVMPGADLIGIDINPRAIAAARAKLAETPDRMIRYECAADLSGEAAGSFDAVLALAVFRHGELERDQPDSCAATLAFSRFEDGVAMLDRVLRPGGILAIWNAHYRMRDTSLAGNYASESLAFTREDPLTLLYGPDNRKIDGPYDEILFTRRPPA
jgi:SAM-dependent methyltransferase